MFFLIYILFNLLLVIILEIVEEIFENEHLGGGGLLPSNPQFRTANIVIESLQQIPIFNYLYIYNQTT